jgi:hypothetical protein
MKVAAFKVADFVHEHERTGFRAFCEQLAQAPDDEEVVVIGNATLPDVVYRNPEKGIEYTYYSVSPDIIVIKKDALMVIEMKSYGGLITISPTNQQYKFNWIYEINGIKGVINEGKLAPNDQVWHNGRAVQAFLEQEFDPVCDDASKGCLWDRHSRLVLFTAQDAQFHAPPSSKWTFKVAALNPAAGSSYNAANIVADVVTPQMHYEVDERPQIHPSKAGMLRIAELLGAKPFRFGVQEAPVAPLPDSPLAEDYAYAGVMRPSTWQPLAQDASEEPVRVPDAVRREPKPVRALRYYIHCIRELATQESRIRLDKPGQVVWVEGIPEGIFMGPGYFAMDESRLPGSFLNPNTRLVYGYMPVVNHDKALDALVAEPLFLANVRLEQTSGGYVCQAVAEHELVINRNSLKSFRTFQNLSAEESEALLADLNTLASPEEKLRGLLELLDMPWEDRFRHLGSYQDKAKDVGVLPLAMVFESTGGFNQRLLQELAGILDIWRHDPAPGDLAWQLLSGVKKADIANDWQAGMISIMPSNYEQAQAVGLSLRHAGGLQVVSGPPGTGKTQVIQNFIANAAHERKTVLLASKNNKAVDVVVDKLNGGIFDFPLIFRTGNKKQNEHFASFLSTLPPMDAEKLLELRRQEPVRRGQLRQQQASLQQLRDRLLEAEAANVELRDADSRIEAFRESYPDLHKIDNWYQPTGGDHGLAVINHVLAAHRQHLNSSVALSQRIKHGRKAGYPWKIILDRLAYQDRLRNELIGRLKSSVPDQVQRAMPVETLADAPDSFTVPLLELQRHSSRYQSNLAILTAFKEKEVLEQWSTLEEQRIKDSRSKLRLDWEDRRQQDRLDAIVNLLTDFRSRTSFDEVMRTFPCCATTTLSAGSKIPLESGRFDFAVIDEASQADIASCLPILYRAKRAVVIGDEMQLRPIVTLPEGKAEELFAAYGLDGEQDRELDYRSTSMLDLANCRFIQAGGQRILLRNHYRCHPDIISYSNRCFYSGYLRIKTESEAKQGVFFHDVPGEAQPRWSNDAEVAYVVARVGKLLGAGMRHDQIGIVTPFKQQSMRITAALRSRNLLSGAAGVLTVDTAHGFQGDERDIMIFSLVVSPNMPDGSIRWIHNVNTDSKNLLNVALTRARKELHLVGNRSVCEKAGGLLRELIDHCDRCKRTEQTNV